MKMPAMKMAVVKMTVVKMHVVKTTLAEAGPARRRSAMSPTRAGPA